MQSSCYVPTSIIIIKIKYVVERIDLKKKNILKSEPF